MAKVKIPVKLPVDFDQRAEIRNRITDESKINLEATYSFVLAVAVWPLIDDEDEVKRVVEEYLGYDGTSIIADGDIVTVTDDNERAVAHIITSIQEDSLEDLNYVEIE